MRKEFGNEKDAEVVEGAGARSFACSVVLPQNEARMRAGAGDDGVRDSGGSDYTYEFRYLMGWYFAVSTIVWTIPVFYQARFTFSSARNRVEIAPRTPFTRRFD